MRAFFLGGIASPDGDECAAAGIYNAVIEELGGAAERRNGRARRLAINFYPRAKMDV